MTIVNKFSTFLVLAFLSLASMQVWASTDSDITTAVQKNLTTNPVTAKSNINVVTNSGVVNLSGNVMTENEASTAVEEANSVDSVRDVNTDKLMVKDSSQSYQDAYITAKVKGAFIREKLFGDQPISPMSINVETKDGVVYLTGTADNAQQESTAEGLAKSVSGVTDVDSKVMVKQ